MLACKLVQHPLHEAVAEQVFACAGACAALLPLAGQCALDWLATLQGCPRLQPLSDKVRAAATSETAL